MFSLAFLLLTLFSLAVSEQIQVLKDGEDPRS